MRRFLLAAAAVLSFGAALAATSFGASNAKSTCPGIDGIDVYFWPQGHGAVPEVGFGPYAPPHQEFYKARDPSNTAFLGFTDVNGQVSLSTRNCTAGADSVARFTAPVGQTTTAQQKLRCTLTGDVEVAHGAMTRVVTRTVLIKRKPLRGKRRKPIRRVVRTTIRTDVAATAGSAQAGGAVVAIEYLSTGMRLRWDPRYCSRVELAG
jgi:hypothetical protein